MKSLILVFILLMVFAVVSYAQSFRGTDRSPMDMAYLPDNFAHDRTEGQEAIIKVVYSRPQKKGREVFGGLVVYGEVWRTGANEATEIKFYRDVHVNGETLEEGNYSLFTIPGENEWTIIFNSDLDYWGAFSYNSENDVLRVNVPSERMTDVVEAFTIQFEEKADGEAIMKLAWDMTLVSVPIEY